MNVKLLNEQLKKYDIKRPVSELPLHSDQLLIRPDPLQSVGLHG